MADYLDYCSRQLEADQRTVLLPILAIITNPRGSLPLDETSSSDVTFVLTRYDGSATITIDSEKHELSAQNNRVSSGFGRVSQISFSADFKGHFVILSRSFSNTIITKNKISILKSYKLPVQTWMSDSDIEGCRHLYEWLKIVIQKHPFDAEEQIRQFLRSAFVLSFNYYGVKHQKPSCRNELITEEFMTLLESCDISVANEKYLASMIQVSPHTLFHAVKTVTGFSPARLIKLHKVNLAKEMVISMEIGTSMTAISERLGFSSPAAFSRFFKTSVGKTPSEFRERKYHYDL